MALSVEISVCYRVGHEGEEELALFTFAAEATVKREALLFPCELAVHFAGAAANGK